MIFNMNTPSKKPCIGDRVRLAGFLGEFEVVRVIHNGSMVDLKHLDLHGPDYIEQEVSAYDLTYLSGAAAHRPAPSAANGASGSGSRRVIGRMNPGTHTRA